MSKFTQEEEKGNLEGIDLLIETYGEKRVILQEGKQLNTFVDVNQDDFLIVSSFNSSSNSELQSIPQFSQVSSMWPYMC